ncbi:MAG TPA: YafY family protein [Chloroflexia bacterium]|nr:YafY family protein [Chloroflexia bacterium]
MNKTDRLMAIVLKLQSSGTVRAEDLAAMFETSVRTIYRDVQALCEAGVPVISTPGKGYSILEGYFLPPLSFSTAEAMMLLLGGEYVAQNFDRQYRAAAENATLKIEGVLPQTVREEVAQIKAGVKLIAHPAGNLPLLQDLRRAVIERKSVTFDYYPRHRSAGKNGAIRREVNPYGLVYVNGSWYMTGYCHLRQAVRNFKLERIENLDMLSETFERPDDFKVARRDIRQNRPITAKVLFSPQITRWVRESRFFFVTGEEETPEGLLVTLQYQQEQEVLNWLLGWGSQMKVLEPDALRKVLVSEAHRILQNHEKVVSLLT